MRKHHLLLVLLLCAALLGGSFVAAAQEDRAETPRTIAALPTTFAAGVLSSIVMPDSGDAINMDTGDFGPEPGEFAPSCTKAGAIGNDSAWFSVYHPGGTLTVDTAFSTGSNFDSIVQVFAYDTMSISDLLEVACNDDFGGSGGNDARVQAVLPSAPYIVRISCLNCTAGVGPTDLALELKFTPPPGAAPTSDIINNNVPITFNKAVKVDNVGFTTVPATENSTLGCTMYHTVWHRFVAPRFGVFTFSTYGSRLVRPFESQDTKLAVYRSSGGPVFANLTELGCNDDSNGSLQSSLTGIVLNAGDEIYVRVGTFSSGNVLAGSQYRITVSPEYMNDIGTNSAFNSGTSGWSLKNTTGSDGIFNDGGDNVFRFFGALGKSAKIKQNVTPSTVLLDKADEGGAFRMLGNYSTASTLSNNAKFILKVTYTDGTPATKVSYATLRITTSYQSITLVAPVASKNVSKISMIVKNSSTGGQLRVDDISLVYTGNPARERKGDGLLPVPAPAWRSGDAATFRGQN